MKRYISIFIFLSAAVLAFGQDNIGGNDLNSYYKVTGVSASSVTCLGEDLSDLKAGDKVLLIQINGTRYFDGTFDIFGNGSYDINSGSAGKHEFLSVLSSNDLTDEVSFTANLKNTYSPDEKIQLVKVFVTDNAVVTSEVSAPAWDGDKGGILALVILGNLTLQADIDLSEKGFRGADALEYDNACRVVPGLQDTAYFEAGVLGRAGQKGEGIMSDTFRYTIGIGNAATGGGGGNGRYGGGGGGGHWGAGGFGGTQTESCGLEIPYATGGERYGQLDFYEVYNRVTFGGGGGGSTYSSSLAATKGGNGGGLLFILADSVIADGGTILNKGQSVVDIATAGAGGGGAGGAVLYDVNTTEGSLNVDVSGGYGGSADAINCGGSGGGGSGGVFYQNGSTLPINITVNTSEGIAGTTCSLSPYAGSNGDEGGKINDYIPVLNGFTFNAITSNDTICINQKPRKLIGTLPKGENPQYQWFESIDSVNWTIISGETERDYQPPVLTQTTYYTREVYLPAPADFRDTARAVKVLVYPAIANNLIDITDTICYNSSPGLLTGAAVSGGDGSYSYHWEASTDQANWTPKGDETTDNLDEQDLLTNSTYYWRIVTSGPKDVCSDTSNIDTITVLPLITNNQFLNTETDTIICNNLDAGTLIGSQPANGDGLYSYSWLVSNDNVSYTPISSNTQSYLPGILSVGNYYYKRVVYSGEGDACIDTTDQTRYVEVLSDISGNLITSDSLRYCSGDAPLELKTDGSISGGNTTYDFQWQQYNGSNWNDIALANAENYLPGVLTDSSVYRRVVSSGLVSGSLYACVDQSTALNVDVIPAIQNVLSSLDETICQNGQPIPFTESAATGGAGGFTYLWEQNKKGAGWENADGAVITDESYTPPILYDSTTYRRVAYSQICQLNSNTIQIVVYDSIADNFIVGGSPQYTCYNSTKELIGTVTSGGFGEPAYEWQTSNDGASWSSTGSINQSYETPDLTAETFYRRVVVSGGAGECKDTSSSVLVKINELPVGDIVASFDTLCINETIEINYEGIAGSGPWEIKLGEPNDTLHIQLIPVLEAPNGTINFTLSESANIQILSLRDDSTCYADLSLSSGEVQATVYEIPDANAGEDAEDCGLTTTLNATLDKENATGLWTPNNFEFNDPTLPNAEVSVNTYGPVTLTWTETTWGHCATSADVVIDFYEQPTVVEAGEDQVLAYDFETTLDGNEPINREEGFWKFVVGEGEIEDSTQANTIVTMEELGEYLLRWTIDNKVCNAISDSVKITINDLSLPNGFSPNGDGINELFTINVPSGNIVKFTIFDRRGGIVHSAEGTEQLTWDGTNDNGVELPPDTYFYIIEEEGVDPKKGFIDLRR